ncbi:MAG: sigma-70 family RNA polymerase sigma factor [Bacteroidota bacterium]|nr:sigma-70 family RNA polymerase sigma factor [Bacteroidota bacterium]
MLTSELYTEESLIQQLKLHDEQAFNYLYDNYSKSLFGIIYQIIPTQEIAEDVVQQVFIKIWNNIDSFEPSKGRLYTWMINITRNQAIDYTRSKDFNRQEQTIAITKNVYNTESNTAAISDTGFKKILEQLPVEKRKLIELSYFLGYTQEEISKIMDIPLGTVKTRLRNTLIDLRKMMNLKST